MTKTRDQPPAAIEAFPLAMVRRDPACRDIVRRWRLLSGGGLTLVGVSGGADSGALAIALRAANSELVVAHVVHDMRARTEALADRDHSRALAESLGCPFVEAEVACRPGNTEATARRERYSALGRLAQEHGAAFVAVGHHADDQLETVLAALVRGAGPRGLAGAAPSRALEGGVRLIRPMLGVSRADAERLCGIAGWAWRHDATNTDTSQLRAAIRLGPAALLRELRPSASARATEAADLLRDAAGLIGDRAADVFGEGSAWARSTLRAERAVVVGEGLRTAALRLTGGVGADRLSGRAVTPIVRAIRDDRTGTRRFRWALGPSIVTIEVGAALVTMRLGADSA